MRLLPILVLPLITLTTALTPNSKRGLAYNSWAATPPFTDTRLTWAYNWGCFLDTQLPSTLEFVPMLHRINDDKVYHFHADTEIALARGSRHILAFNEPDHVEQANMSPAEGVAAYREHIMRYSGRAQLGAPAVSAGPDGLSWMGAFRDLCVGCQVDFWPIHLTDFPLATWSEGRDTMAYLKDYVCEAYRVGGGKPLWITEFNLAGYVAEADQINFMDEFMAWLDAQWFVERYAWFMADAQPHVGSAALVTQDNQLTTLGQHYAYN